MQTVTVRAVGQLVGAAVLLIALYSISNQDVAALAALSSRADAQHRSLVALRSELDALLQVRWLVCRVRQLVC